MVLKFTVGFSASPNLGHGHGYGSTDAWEVITNINFMWLTVRQSWCTFVGFIQSTFERTLLTQAILSLLETIRRRKQVLVSRPLTSPLLIDS